ncbi:40S ribosomal protein S9-2 [Zea mays]|uniref:40S ribosomal protein S9-2 n=1 Tax=Zea mays TaxID=4577 RepID=A0A1D6K4H9_MAIZE|nr:40S ribosomal protein S9-2 [Zea mays]
MMRLCATHDGRLRHFVCNVAVLFSLMLPSSLFLMHLAFLCFFICLHFTLSCEAQTQLLYLVAQ